MRTWIFALFCLLAMPVGATEVAEQPYRITDARIATDVFVNGKGPYSFLLDTAASRSMMFEHTRARLGLATTGEPPLTVYGMQNIGTAIPVSCSTARSSPGLGLIRSIQTAFSGSAVMSVTSTFLREKSVGTYTVSMSDSGTG